MIDCTWNDGLKVFASFWVLLRARDQPRERSHKSTHKSQGERSSSCFAVLPCFCGFIFGMGKVSPANKKWETWGESQTRATREGRERERQRNRLRFASLTSKNVASAGIQFFLGFFLERETADIEGAEEKACNEGRSQLIKRERRRWQRRKVNAVSRTC